MNSLEILVLAGGKATRFPNKLRHRLGDIPMLVRVCRTFSSSFPTYVSCSVRDVAHLEVPSDCKVVADRWPDRGPLGGILSTMEVMQSPLVFVIAGDMPFVDISLVISLHSQHTGEDAVVPVSDDEGTARTSPLAAIYARPAFLREGTALLERGEFAMRRLLDRLRVRYVPMLDAGMLRNINTLADYRRHCCAPAMQ